MAPGNIMSPFVFFLSSFIWSADQKIITAECGQNVTLTCRAPDENNNIVEWSRADLKTEHVLVYRKGKFIAQEQHPYFRDRADLQDKRMKNGNVSLILTNVTAADNESFECRVQRDGDSSMQLIDTIYLRVIPPGPGGGLRKDGGKEVGVSRGYYGLAASFVFLSLLFAVFVIAVKLLKKNSSQHPAENT